MKKITKKNGIELLEKGQVKRVLTGYVSKEQAEQLLGMNNKEFIEKTKGCTVKKVLKSSATQIVFSDKEEKKSWLTDLTGSKWYLVENLNGRFILIEFPDDKDYTYIQSIAYQLI